MLKNIFLWILQKVFRIETQTTTKELEENEKYAVEYERIDGINFNSIFSNKLANYVVTDSNLDLTGENARVELLDKVGQSMWKKAKKITSMGFGYGGIVIVPYAKGGKIYYNLVPQNRLTIDETDGENITGATILAEKRVVKQAFAQDKVYLRWTNYKVKNNVITITQSFTDDRGNTIPVPEFWRNIQESMSIGDVDRVLFGYIKSPINNRKSNDKYGVPITYGCEKTIAEIKETMKQLFREYKLKETFVGADVTMFNGNNALPVNGLFKKIDAGEDDFFEVFDPQFRSYTDRLQELYVRLEHEIGTSAGIISKVESNNATATEIKRAMFDTFTIVDDMRTNIEKGLEDFFYSANVLANAYNITPNGEYELSFNWSYSLLEDTDVEFDHMLEGNSRGIISDVELRQWIKPDESLEDSEKAIAKIKEEEPSVDKVLKEDEEKNEEVDKEQEEKEEEKK